MVFDKQVVNAAIIWHLIMLKEVLLIFLIRCFFAEVILVLLQKVSGLTTFLFVNFVGPQRTTEEESSSAGSVVETPILRRILTRPRRSKLPREINLASLP
jgi:hypothetical protein